MSNRQRAFRERREARLRELMEKISTIKTSRSSLQKDNEKLRQELIVVRAENELLRITCPSENQLSTTSSLASSPTQPPEDMTSSLPGFSDLLSWKAAFQLIQEHEIFQKGQANLEDLATRMNLVAKHSDSQVLPFFFESDIKTAIEQSIEKSPEIAAEACYEGISQGVTSGTALQAGPGMAIGLLDLIRCTRCT
jgi:hypothetical protein